MCFLIMWLNLISIKIKKKIVWYIDGCIINKFYKVKLNLKLFIVFCDRFFCCYGCYSQLILLIIHTYDLFNNLIISYFFLLDSYFDDFLFTNNQFILTYYH